MKPLAWTIFALICAGYVVGAYFGWETRSYQNSDSWGTGGLLPSIAFMLTTFMLPLVGVLIATRRPGTLEELPRSGARGRLAIAAG